MYILTGIKAYNKQTSQYLSRDDDDLPEYSSPAVTRAQTPAKGAVEGEGGSQKRGKGKKWKLEEVERWTMVKRIW